MKRVNFALMSLFFANSIYAAYPIDGWYLGLTGGFSHTSNTDVLGPNPSQFVFINSIVNPHPVPVHIPSLNNNNNNNSFAFPFTSPVISPFAFPFASPFVSPFAFPFPNLTLIAYVTGLPLVNPFNPVLNFPHNQFVASTNGDVQYKVGGTFGGQLGYRICNFRVEGQLLFNYSPLSSVKIGGTSIKRHVTLFNPLRVSGRSVLGAGLINGYFDFFDEEYDPTWVPYLGIGIGYGSVSNSVNFSLPYLFVTPFSLRISESSSTPVGQAILGISYFFADDISVGFDYRYMTTRTLSSINSRLHINAFNFNFNYYYN